jgi:predicted nucleic acid-binding protein
MKLYVLNANAVIRFMLLWNDWERVKALLDRAKTGDAKLAMSVVNWGEVIYTMAKYIGLDNAVADLRVLGPAVETVEVGERMAEEAAELKHNFKLGYDNSFSAALAMSRNATLVTADPDFAKLGKRLKLMALTRHGS